MQNYIGLLRGINVGGHRKIRMAELKGVLSNSGFQQVQTYIQSGNIVFKSEGTEPRKLAAKIQKLILDNFGFEVPVLVISVQGLRAILKDCPFDLDDERNQLFFTLLKNLPSNGNIGELNRLNFENEICHISEKCVYLNFVGNYRNAKLNNNFIEKKLKVEATTRNLKTMKKLIELSED